MSVCGAAKKRPRAGGGADAGRKVGQSASARYYAWAGLAVPKFLLG
jgi:hypothetical protein